MLHAWLTHLMERLRGSPPPRSGGQAAQVEQILARRGSFRDDAAFLDALSAQLAKAGPLEEETIQLLVAHLRGHCGEELDRLGPDVQAHLAFWTDLCGRSASQLARVCRADLLLRAGEPDVALAELLDAVDCDPGVVHFRTELHHIARERGGEAWLRYRLACLRAALAGLRDGPGEGEGVAGGTSPAQPIDDEADDDHVRELYCELLEEHRGDPDALMRIQELGALIDLAVDRGELPRAIVRRHPRP